MNRRNFLAGGATFLGAAAVSEEQVAAYRGRGIDPGQKSLAILVLMQDTERTLTDVEIDATMAGLLQVLAVRFGATLRQ